MKYLYQAPKAAVALYRDFLQKNNAPNPTPKKRRSSFWAVYLLLLIVAFLLTSCGGSGAESEDALALLTYGIPLISTVISLAALCGVLYLAFRVSRNVSTLKLHCHLHHNASTSLSALEFKHLHLIEELLACHVSPDGKLVVPIKVNGGLADGTPLTAPILSRHVGEILQIERRVSRSNKPDAQENYRLTRWKNGAWQAAPAHA